MKQERFPPDIRPILKVMAEHGDTEAVRHLRFLEGLDKPIFKSGFVEVDKEEEDI